MKALDSYCVPLPFCISDVEYNGGEESHFAEVPEARQDCPLEWSWRERRAPTLRAVSAMHSICATSEVSLRRTGMTENETQNLGWAEQNKHGFDVGVQGD